MMPKTKKACWIALIENNMHCINRAYKSERWIWIIAFSIMKMCVKCFELTCLQLKYSTMLNFNPYKYNAIFSISAIQQAFFVSKTFGIILLPYWSSLQAAFKRCSVIHIHTYIHNCNKSDTRVMQ